MKRPYLEIFGESVEATGELARLQRLAANLPTMIADQSEKCAALSGELLEAVKEGRHLA